MDTPKVLRKATLGPPINEGDEGTASPYVSDSGYKCIIEELPDRQNKKDRSRVNASVYYCEMWDSPHHGHVYRLHKQNPDGTHNPDVDGHTFVLIHIGNLAGDVDMGYASDSEACMLPGMCQALFRDGETVGKHTLTKDQHGVVSSGVALAGLVSDMKGEPFLLTVIR